VGAIFLTGGSLKLSNGGVIQTIAGTGSHTDTIASAITIQGDGGISYFSRVTLSATQPVCVISGAASGVSTTGNTTTLYLDGR